MTSTVSQRLAARLQQWFRAARHGSQARLVAFSKSRPGGTSISAQNLSYFLNGRRSNPITLDDLDDLAAFFGVSIGELLDDRSSDLSGDEQRLVWLFRALPPATQRHLLGLLAPAALSPQFVPVLAPTGTDPAVPAFADWLHN